MDKRKIIYRGKYHDIELDAVTHEYVRAEKSQYFSDPGAAAEVDTEYYYNGKRIKKMHERKRRKLDDIIIFEFEYEIHEEMYRISCESRERKRRMPK